MKLGRVVLLSLGVVVLLLLAAVTLAFTPAVQTWAVRHVIAGQPGLDATLERVSAGLNHVHLENVRVSHAGTVLTLPTADLDLPVIAAATSQEVKIQRLEAHGWTLDLTQAALPAPPAPITRVDAPREFSLLPSAYAAAPAGSLPVAPAIAFAGIFSQLKLPVDLSLAVVDLSGVVLLPSLPGQPAARADVTLTGGDLAAGHPGKFEYTAVIKFAGEGVAVRELRVRGTLEAVMDTPRTFTRLVAALVADATGPKFPGGVKLSADLSAARTAADENYALAVRTGAKQIATVETSYAVGESHLRGSWRLDMHDADLAPFVLGRELPAFEAIGDGRFDLDTSFAELNASGRLNATADRLVAINPQLGVLGSVRFTADFDVAQRGNATRVDRLAVTLIGAKPIATVQALQAFEFNLKTGELNVADPTKDLLGAVFQGLPLSWVAPLVSSTGFVLTGKELQGELVASARNGGFTVRSKAPLTMGNVSISLHDGRPLLNAVDLSLSASGDYSPQGWQLEFAPFSASTGDTPLFSLALKAGQLAGANQPIKLAGKWTAQLRPLLAQPVAGSLDLLSAGQAQGDFAANLGPKREFQVNLALTGLVAPQLGALPSLTTNTRADLDADGKISFNVPLVFTQAGRKSDLTFAGTLAPGATVHALAGRVTSDLLVIDDVQAFAFPFLGAPVASGPSEGTTHTAAPFWSTVAGQCSVALKKVNWNDQTQVTDVGGTLTVDSTALKLSDLHATFGPDSGVKLNASVTFNPAATPAYGFAADLALDNFDMGAVFRAVDPTKPPTIDGRVNLQSHLTGAAVSLAELPEHTRGDLKLTGKSGIFRALSVDLSDQVQKTSSMMAFGSMLGLVSDNVVNKTKIVADIAKSLSEIPYDQLSLTATRDESLNLLIKDFTLISPEVRIGGSGTARYSAGTPLLAQALEAQFTLGARGKIGEQMKRAGFLEAQQDNLGYSAFAVPLKLGGTLAHPDSRAIRDAFINFALEKSGLLDSLFGGKGK